MGGELRRRPSRVPVPDPPAQEYTKENRRDLLARCAVLERSPPGAQIAGRRLRIDGAHPPSRMNYQITVRHGKKIQRYLTFSVEAPDAVTALREAADRVPAEIAPEADLVELRSAPDPGEREGSRLP